MNRLIHALPDGYVVDTGWLASLGLTPSSIRDYVARGWLERVGPRLYRRPAQTCDPSVRWSLAVLSLQTLLREPCHIGGMTALELAGYWQYAPAGRRHIWLYSDAPRVRSYLGRLTLDADMEIRSRKLFADPDLGVETRSLDLVTATLGPANEKSEMAARQQLRVSSLERAILETLEEVPRRVGFAHGGELFEGLTTLRPKLMLALLEACRSVKAKRLFLYFASQQRYAWTRKLQTADIDIGSGKRQIVPGGELDPQYLITVPRSKRSGRPKRTTV